MVSQRIVHRPGYSAELTFNFWNKIPNLKKSPGDLSDCTQACVINKNHRPPFPAPSNAKQYTAAEQVCDKIPSLATQHNWIYAYQSCSPDSTWGNYKNSA
jgi:hypothetical protein